jgi:pimeloyl-ACP methyl ester carboxylesterase
LLSPKPVRVVTGCFLGVILFVMLLVLLQASSHAGTPAAAASNPLVGPSQVQPPPTPYMIGSDPQLTMDRSTAIKKVPPLLPWEIWGEKVELVRHIDDSTTLATAQADGSTTRVSLASDGMEGYGGYGPLTVYAHTNSTPPPNIRVNDDVENVGQDYAAVTADQEGNAYAIWRDWRDGCNIYSAKLVTGSESWSSNIQVNDGETGCYLDRTDIAADAQGNVYAVWGDLRNSRQNGDIYASKLIAGTMSWSANVRVNDTAAIGPNSAAIAVDGAGNAHAVWSDNREFRQIYYSQLPAGSTNWGPNLNVNGTASPTGFQPSIAADTLGNAYTIWQGWEDGRMYAAKLVAGSTQWEDNTSGLSETRGHSSDIAVDQAGNAYAVWEGHESGVGSIHFATLPAGSNAWETSVLLDDYGKDPSIAVDAAGNIYVAYVGYHPFPDPDVWLAIRKAGETTWSTQKINDDVGDAHQYGPSIAASEEGRAYLVWADERNAATTGEDIYSAVVSIPEPTPCTEWNLAYDFRVSPNQANPNPDNCRNSNVWYFMQSGSLAHNPTTYSLLPEFITDAFYISGLQQWQGTSGGAKDKLPAVGINATGDFQQVNTISWPAGAVHVHPLPSQLAIVAWRSPSNGRVSITGAVTDLDANGGNGIDWFIDRGTTTLAYGSIPNGGAQNFQDGVSGSNLSNVSVSQGDFLYFIVDAKEDHYFDSTGLNVTITLLKPLPDRRGEQGPSKPPREWYHLKKMPANGDIDEGFYWTHPAVTFENGQPQCDKSCLAELQNSYDRSASEPFSIPITITRYYGKVNDVYHLITQTMVFTAAVGILAYDVDPMEPISIKINGCTLNGSINPKSDDWDYSIIDAKRCLGSIRFPSAPGHPSNPTDPSSNPGQPVTRTATNDIISNTITIAVEPPHKALIGGVRLIIKAVRPVVLVPGFGAQANTYCWGISPYAEGCKEERHPEPETFYQDLTSWGVSLERPCHYKWSEEVIRVAPGPQPPSTPELITVWFKRVYYYQSGWTDDRDIDHDGDPDNRFPVTKEFHPRCFEASESSKNGTGKLARNAKALKATIQELKKRYGVAKVNLVGHSKGGLFARAYASQNQIDASYGDDVENVISISTPHLGAYLMDLAIFSKPLPPIWLPLDCLQHPLLCLNYPSPLELHGLALLAMKVLKFAPFSEQGNEISVRYVNEGDETKGDPDWNDLHTPADGVRYYSIVATAGQPGNRDLLDIVRRGEMGPFPFSLVKDPLSLFSTAYQLQYYHPKDAYTSRGQSDIAITAPSQRMKRIGRGFENLDANGTGGEPGCWWIRANHEESSRIGVAARAVAKALGLTGINSTGVNQCDGLETDPTVVPSTMLSNYEMQATSAFSETHQPLLFAGSIFTYGVSITVPFAVDGSDLEVFGYWNGDSQIQLELTDALGARITPASAIGNGNIAYTETLGVDSGVAQYVITDTVKGDWMAHIIAPASGPADRIDWNLLISQKSPISFTLSTTAETYPFGSPVLLRGTLFTDTVPVQGANVLVELSSSLGVTDTITLLDDGLHNDLSPGDGIYGNQWAPPAAGHYFASAVVTGTLPSGIPYMRQGRALFRVMPASAHFSDVYSDTGADEDGDGLFEKLRIQVGIILDQDGRYGVSGVLATPDGTELGATAAVVSGTAGISVTANLDFDSSLLLKRTSDGPVVLRALYLL